VFYRGAVLLFRSFLRFFPRAVFFFFFFFFFRFCAPTSWMLIPFFLDRPAGPLFLDGRLAPLLQLSGEKVRGSAPLFFLLFFPPHLILTQSRLYEEGGRGEVASSIFCCIHPSKTLCTELKKPGDFLIEFCECAVPSCLRSWGSYLARSC